MTANEKIIVLKSIEFSYNGLKAIDNISVNIKEGVYGLLGPNGAGKTTLIKILLGFLTPESGSGSVLGYDIRRERKNLRRCVGYMPENDSSIPGMDAVTLTAYMGQLSGMPRQEAIKRAHEVLYYVGLEESRYRKVETYSSGMKQRLRLALALVHDPKLLFLDEPTSGMDPQGRKDMLELINNIAHKNTMSIIISSHILPDVEFTCQYVIILHKGKIAAEQDISGTNRDSFNRFELKFKGDPVHFLERIQSMNWTIEQSDRGFYQVLMPSEKTSLELFKIAIETNVQIRHLKRYKTTLEDTFIRAIGE